MSHKIARPKSRPLSVPGKNLVEPAASAGQVGHDNSVRFNQAYEHASIGIVEVDAEGRILRANSCFCHIVGYTLQELQSLRFHQFTHPDDLAACVQEYDKLISGQVGHMQIEKRYVHKDGHVVWGDLSATITRDAAGKVLFSFVIVQDITVRKQAEAALRESEARYRLLTELSPLIIWESRPDGSISYANQCWYDYTGLSREQTESTEWVQAIHPAHQQRVWEAWVDATAYCHDYDVEMPIRRAADGQYRWYLARSLPLRDHEGKILKWIGMAVDIHDRKQMEEVWQKANERVRVTLESITDAFVALDRNWCFTYVNEMGAKLLGKPREAMLGAFAGDLFPEMIKSALGQHCRRAMRLQVPQHFDAPYPPLRAWFDCHCYPYADEGLSIFFTEITARKMAEEELKAAKVAAEAANLSKSSFLANMSHEIRTPLGAILGFSEFLKDPGLTPDERKSFINTISRNGQELLRLIDDILDLSKVEAGHLEIETIPMSLSHLMADVTASLSLRAREQALAFQVESEGPIPSMITSDPTRLRQILLNVIGNAIKFTKHGHVKVKVRQQRSAHDDKLKIVFVISDTGRGISPEEKERIFRPFSQADSSTTRKFGGTGLGLTLSRKLAQALGGDVVLATSRMGKGSTFVVSIDPGAVSGSFTHGFSPQVEVQAWDAQRHQLTGARILVAEDALDNQCLIKQCLTMAGASVQIAENGADAVSMALHDDFDVILMDIQMPVLDGYEATRQLRRHGYQKPIIALTAHAMKEERARSFRHGCNDHLTKPIVLGDLVQAVARYVTPMA